MERQFLIILLCLISSRIWCVDYPVYTPDPIVYGSPRVSSPNRDLFKDAEPNSTDYVYRGYSSPIYQVGASGVESSSGQGKHGKGRRDGNETDTNPSSHKDGEGGWYWIDNGDGTAYWFYEKTTDANGGDVGNRMPIGEPLWPMLAFAVFAAGVITLRRIYGYGEHRKAES